MKFTQEQIDQYVEENYDRLKDDHRRYLMEQCGYSRIQAENTDDGFDEFVLEDMKNSGKF